MVAPKKRALPKPKPRTSIYTGTDKSTDVVRDNRGRPRKTRDEYRNSESMDVIQRGGGITDKLGRSAIVGSSKKGNVVTSRTYSQAPYREGGNNSVYSVRENQTTLGKGGRRESTLTKKYTLYPSTQKLKGGDFEIYGYSSKPVVKEVQHNRGSGTRKTGSKNKGY